MPAAAARAILALAFMFAVPAADAAARAVGDGDLGAVIHRTEHGTPHIVASGDAGLGFGYGYAVATDNICLLAESYMTVAGERSRFLGPDGKFEFHANGAEHGNLQSDLFYRQVNESGAIERLLSAPPPVGVDRRVQRLVRGYVAGYNRYLADVGRDGITDPACRGKPWVRPITEKDAYGRFMQLASLAGGGLAITGIANAQPPPGGAGAGSSDAERAGLLDDLAGRLGLGGLGSNALALGGAGTQSGAGMVLANPHLPWKGGYRLYQAQLTIPGRMDVTGATFIGVPFVVIGHTRGLAWSHTTSSAFRFTPVELKLQPGSPTTYLVDGEPRPMTERTIAVPVLRPDGSVGEERRTLWSTEYGPVLTELLGLPLFPWTPQRAYAFGDANAENLRYLNHFYAADRAQSVGDLEHALHRHQGIPWANTIAADSDGNAFYADASVVPNVDDARAARCNTELGAAAFARLRLPVLDGSRSDCRWGDDPDAVVPGIFGPGKLPFLRRSDYVENSNDSYWLSNPDQPLEGFARIVGDERSERSLRTRLGLRMVREQLAEGPFDLDALMRLQFSDRHGAAELVRDQLVGLCRSMLLLPSSGGPVQKGDACEVLARWDGRDRADSRGALLFRRWAERALVPPVPGANAVGGGAPTEGTWIDPFDPDRPVDTPSQLNLASPVVQQALGDAVNDLRSSGIPLDAPLGDWQYEPRDGERLPMHGGPGRIGVFNALNVHWEPGAGYPEIPHGGTFLMAAEVRGRCPRARTLVTYSQSADPTSPWHADQTRMFSRGEWAADRFCERDVLRSPALTTERPACLPPTAGRGGDRIAWIAPGMPARRVPRVTGRPDRRRGQSRRWCVEGGGQVTALTGRSRVRLVATTSRRQRVAGARPGRRVRGSGWRVVGSRYRVRRVGGTVAVARVSRRGRVRWAGFTGGPDARSPSALAALAHRARLPR